MALGLTAVLLVTAAVAGWAVALSRRSPGSLPNDRVHESVATLRSTNLEITTNFGATIGYLPTPVRAVANISGIVTWLPAAGNVISQGQPLFQVDGQPVILLYGSVPEWRSLAVGVPTGPDITELAQNLNQLGYAGAYQLPENGIYSYAVDDAVQRLLTAKGIAASTGLALGTVLYAPGPVLVSALPMALGASVNPGTAVITITSTQRAVTGMFTPRGGPPVEVGQTATVTPDGGGASLAGTVAGATTKFSNGSNQTTVTMALAGSPSLPLGDIPVQAAVVTETVPHVLAVPVQALVALVEGGYALQLPAGKGRKALVTVKVGVSGAGNLVQVSGPKIRPGLRYLVPSLY